MMYFAHTDSIDKLGLSVRCYNALTKAGVKTVSQFMKVDDARVVGIRNMGARSIEEMQKTKQKIKVISPYDDESNITTASEKECMKAVFSLLGILPCHPGELFKSLLPDFENRQNAPANPGNPEWNPVFLRKLVRQHMLEVLEKNPFGLDYGEFIGFYKDSPIARKEVLAIYGELVGAGEVTGGSVVHLNKPSLRDYALGIENKKHGEMFMMRLMGKTLEEIGENFGHVTREGVRQVINKCIERKKVLVREDRYVGVFQTYDFTKNDFLQIFEVDDFCYVYLTLMCTKTRKAEPHLFIEDKNYPAALRKKAEEILFRNFFTINGKKVQKKRTDLADYVCRAYFKNEAAFDKFVEKYNQVVRKLGVHKDPKFIVNRATYQNRFSESENVLWKYQSRFRYYGMDGYDFTSLLEGLDLERYKNVEYSTLKFFRVNRELMAEYDIRDEYELHNLLRKLYAKKKDPNITFSRMPIIEFGKPDREKQVFELLRAKAPIDVRGFCEAYEDEYGVLARTVSGGFISGIAKYRDNNGIYNLHTKPLPKNQLEKLKSLLDRDYYDFSFILNLYDTEFPESGMDTFSSYSLKELGFRVFTSYCIRDTFVNAIDYFRHILTGTDYVDLRDLPRSLTSHTSFTSEMYALKASFEIIEYEPHKFVSIRKLNERGITKNDLRGYCDKVAMFVMPFTHFTIKKLRNQGFTHPLHGENYKDWFYASLLTVDKKRFSYQRMGGSKIFRMGAERTTMESLISAIVQKNDGISFQGLLGILDAEYGLSIDKYKIGAILDSSPLYYDRLEDRIYRGGATSMYQEREAAL